MTSAFETFWAYRSNGDGTFHDGGAPVSSILEMSAEEKHGVDWQKGEGLSHRARAFVLLSRACLAPAS